MRTWRGAPLGEGILGFDEFLRAFVACYFGFVALHYTARLMGLRARTGIPRATIGQGRSRNGVHQIVFRVFRALILVLMALRVAYPEIDVLLGAIRPLETVTVGLAGLAGLVLMAGGLFVVDYSHTYLANDWQSGIGGGAGVTGQLVTTGPYAVSRNPIFAGILTGQFGLFLAAPSVFTLVCLIVGIWVILRQVRVEERALGDIFGPSYALYRQQVPRWYSLGGFFRQPAVR